MHFLAASTWSTSPAWLKDDDHKHVEQRDGAKVVDLGEHKAKLSNLMVEVAPTGGLRCGGLFSLDGMHLTASGNALMAGRVVEAQGLSGLTPPDPVAMASAGPAQAVWAMTRAQPR